MTTPITDPHGVTWTWRPDFEAYAASFESIGSVYAMEKHIRSGKVSEFWLKRSKA